MDWVPSTIAIAWSYIYFLLRIQLSMGGLSYDLILGFTQTIVLFSFGCYINSRTLKREFIVSYKANESSKELKEFLKSLPEGVSIIDNLDSEIKFINNKMKEVFHPKLFLDTHGNTEKLNEIHQVVENQFNCTMEQLEAENGEDNSEDFLKWFMNKFDVTFK